MESIDSTPNSPMQENLLTNEHLQACCEEITTQINRYDYYIRRQLEKTIKNYKICIELCEEKLNLLDTYKDYRSVLATLSAGKKDLSTTNEITNFITNKYTTYEQTNNESNYWYQSGTHT